MSLKPLLRVIVSYIPGLYKLLQRGTGGTTSARYCYSVWLRHLVRAHENGLSTQPEIVAELGPGDSLGIGLAALISGANKYYALDVIRYANSKRNLEIFDELVDLFRQRENIPNERELEAVKPYLNSYEFPRHIFNEARLNKALDPNRLSQLRKALSNLGSEIEGGYQISYFVPWYDSMVIKEETIDMIYSQAVLEHVDDLPMTYGAMFQWLKSGGFISHQIDFKCHETAQLWNGHWGYSDFMWRIIQNNRPDRINRYPHSTHLHLIQNAGFKLVGDAVFKDATGIQRQQLAPRFQSMTDDDLTTTGAFVQAVKEITLLYDIV